MPTQNLLYKREIPVNDDIKIVVPTVGEILENEDGYYGMVSALTAMPIDMMVQLDDMGLDFTKINDYQLFLMLFSGMKTQDTRLVFGDLDLSRFQPAINEETQSIALVDSERDIVIDRSVQRKIAATLRTIHHLEQDRRKPGNDEARAYMIERARIKMKRNAKKARKSQLEPLIVAMVNAEQYKYDFEGTLGLTIYQFNECVRQIIKKVDYEHRMFGVYMGTVKASELSSDELNWVTDGGK